MKLILELFIPDELAEASCAKEGITLDEFVETMKTQMRMDMNDEVLPGAKVQFTVIKGDA